MATAGVPLWSTTAASNSNADPAVNWTEGQAPSSVNDSARAMMASVAKWRDDLYGLTTAGTSTAYTVATNATYASATAMSGAVFIVIPHATNGAAATLAVDGLTARALNSSPSVAVAAGALREDVPYIVKYVHASTEFIVLGILDATAVTDPATDDTLQVYDTSESEFGRITVANFLKIINLLTADASPSASADYVMTYDTSATAAKKVLLQNLPGRMPRGYKDGCKLSNGTDATNDINIAAGACRDSTNTIDITVAAMAGKQLDANWAPGAGAGMRNSAVGIANDWYHIYAVAKADGTQDVYAYAGVAGTDPDSAAFIEDVIEALQAESGGTDYLYARRIGSVERASAAIRAFTQAGDQILWITPVLDLSDSLTSTASLRALTVPDGLEVIPIIATIIDSGNGTIYLSSPDQTDSAPGASTFWTETTNTNYAGGGAVVPLRTNSSRQIRARASTTLPTRILTIGYFDRFGRDA